MTSSLEDGKWPEISLIMPCRNEEAFIGECLNSVLESDYPSDLMEILVVDGMSEDKTRNIVHEMMVRHPELRLLENPAKITPSALNIGISNARGEIIIRIDAHARYPKNYFSVLVNNLTRLKADNVGGVWQIHPGNSTAIAKAIAVATSSRFGIGDAAYKNPGKKIKEVDTVPYGCYPREVFNKIGMFDEELVRNQDDEFNARLRKAGGKIFLIPDLYIEYYARPGLLSMSKMFFEYGFYKPMVNRKTGYIISLRQVIPFLFVLYLFSLTSLIWISGPVKLWMTIPLFLYLGINLTVSLFSASKRQDPRLLVLLPPTFLLIHISYGLGYLLGIFRLFNGFKRNVSQLKVNN